MYKLYMILWKHPLLLIYLIAQIENLNVYYLCFSHYIVP